MKRILLPCLVLLMLQILVPTFAYSEEIANVSISPSVQDQLRKADSTERGKMEAAIDVGNKYAPHHFDGTAYARNDDEEEKNWMRNIHPLVNRNTDWYSPGGVFSESSPALYIDGKKVSFEVVCPQPELISVSSVNNQIELEYRSKIIGMWKTKSTTFTEGDILLGKKGEYDEVLLMFDDALRISKVASKYAVYPSIPEQGINLFKAYIEHPSLRSVPQASSQDAELAKYKQYIELIKQEEIEACR